MEALGKNFEPARILVIQLRQIGDVLLCTPAVHALRKRFPHAWISFLAEPVPAQVLAGNPDLNEVILRDPSAGGLEPVRLIAAVRRKKFDLVVDFLANPRTALISLLSSAPVTISYANNRRRHFYTHPVEPAPGFAALQKLSLLRPLGIANEPGDLVMMVPAEAEKKIAGWAEREKLAERPRPLVCLEPFMKWPALTYPAESFARLCRLMIEQWGATVIVCWGPGRREEADALATASGAGIILAPPTSLHELAALYRRCDLWVGVDGGPRHLAASQGLPTFAVLGPSDNSWTPPGPRHLSVWHPRLPCVPCNRRVCPEGHQKCMKEFPAEEVFEHLDAFRKRLSLPPSSPTEA